MRSKRIGSGIIVVALGMLTTLPSGALPAHDLVRNPGFEGAFSGPVSFTGPGGGPVAASNWIGFNNGGGTTTTEVVPSTAPNGGVNMIHVTTENGSSGLVQTGITAAPNTGVPRGVVQAAVYVVSGGVQVCFGPLGHPPCQAFSHGTGHWERISGPIKPPADHAGHDPSEVNHEIVIYSLGASPAEFYVDNVSVVSASI